MNLFFAMLFGLALSLLPELHHHHAVGPQRVRRSQFQHQAGVESQTVGHLDVSGTASYRRLKHDRRQIFVAHFLRANSGR